MYRELVCGKCYTTLMMHSICSFLANGRLLQTLLNLSLNPCKYISQQQFLINTLSKSVVCFFVRNY